MPIEVKKTQATIMTAKDRNGDELKISIITREQGNGSDYLVDVDTHHGLTCTYFMNEPDLRDMFNNFSQGLSAVTGEKLEVSVALIKQWCTTLESCRREFAHDTHRTVKVNYFGDGLGRFTRGDVVLYQFSDIEDVTSDDIRFAVQYYNTYVDGITHHAYDDSCDVDTYKQVRDEEIIKLPKRFMEVAS